MGLIIKNKKHYLTRLPIWLLIIIVIGLSPIIVDLVGAGIFERFTGEVCNEGNCFWGALPWLMFYSVPFAIIPLLIYLVIIIVDSFQLLKK